MTLSDDLRVVRQTKCAEKGHQFDRETYGICMNCQLTVTRPREKHPPLPAWSKRRMSNKKIGFLVVAEGKASDLRKFYDNKEDADTHYELMTQRGFAQSVEMFEVTYEIGRSVKRAEAEEYRNRDTSEQLQETGHITGESVSLHVVPEPGGVSGSSGTPSEDAQSEEQDPSWHWFVSGFEQGRCRLCSEHRDHPNHVNPSDPTG